MFMGDCKAVVVCLLIFLPRWVGIIPIPKQMGGQWSLHSVECPSTLEEKHTAVVTLASSDSKVEHLLWKFNWCFTVGQTMAACFFTIQSW